MSDTTGLEQTLKNFREQMNDMLEIPHIKGDRDFSHMIKLCNELLTVKGHDYTQGAEGDRGRLKNFYVGADRIGVKPIQILSVYLHKHQSAIDTFVQTGQVQSEGIEGRIADSINYLLLMWKMIAYEKREIEKKKPQSRGPSGVLV